MTHGKGRRATFTAPPVRHRGFTAFPLWQQAVSTEADLLWRAKTNAVLPPARVLSDGSYLSELAESTDPRPERGLPMRVIEYAIADPGRPQAETTRYRLITTILDPDAAPADGWPRSTASAGSSRRHSMS